MQATKLFRSAAPRFRDVPASRRLRFRSFRRTPPARLQTCCPWRLHHTGAFIYVPSRMARDVITKVRVHDTSRDASSFGVEIPVVSDLDFAATVRLAGIPTDARFRSTLRVYAYDARNFGPVTLRVRDADDGTLLATVPVALTRLPEGGDPLSCRGADFARPDHRAAPQPSAAAHRHRRFRCDPADLGLRLDHEQSDAGNHARHAAGFRRDAGEDPPRLVDGLRRKPHFRRRGRIEGIPRVPLRNVQNALVTGLRRPLHRPPEHSPDQARCRMAERQ